MRRPAPVLFQPGEAFGDIGPALSARLDEISAERQAVELSAARLIDAAIAAHLRTLHALFPRHRFGVVNCNGAMFVTCKAPSRRHHQRDQFLGELAFRHRREFDRAAYYPAGRFTDTLDRFWNEVETICELMVRAEDDYNSCVDGSGVD